MAGLKEIYFYGSFINVFGWFEAIFSNLPSSPLETSGEATSVIIKHSNNLYLIVIIYKEKYRDMQIINICIMHMFLVLNLYLQSKIFMKFKAELKELGKSEQKE